MPEDWVQIYFNQKDINYISPSNIRTWVLKPTLPSYTISSPILSPPSVPDILWASPAELH